MHAYHDMIYEVLRHGTRKENRTGVDTLSTFNHNYELVWDPSMLAPSPPFTSMGGLTAPRVPQHVLEPYQVPLLTTKEMSWKNIVIELLWFLSGSINVSFLRRHGCKFWDPWVDDEGDVPSAYGHFWRSYPSAVYEEGYGHTTKMNDQLAWIVDTLRRDPMSRRCVMMAWEPENAQHSKLPPCHFASYFNVQLNPAGEQRLCLHLTQRSCDLALGVPYNMASYGLLLLIMSHILGIKPGIFAHTLCDLHIYTAKPDGQMAEHDHIPGLLEQRLRTPRKLPCVTLDPALKELRDIEALLDPSESTDDILTAFLLTGYDPHPSIPFKVAV